MSLITQFNNLQSRIFPSVIHPSFFPYPLLDLFGAIRLSVVVDQIVRERNGLDVVVTKEKGKKVAEAGKGERPSFLQEGAGILMIVLGGDTFVAICNNTRPLILTSPLVPLLFLGIHFLLTRTPLRSLIPHSPGLFTELPLGLFDALGRCLVLTTFSIDPLVDLSPQIQPTTWQMLITPWIMTVPFASLTFALDFFSSSGLRLSTPSELRPNGWTAVDFWSPLLISWIYITLTGISKECGVLLKIVRSILWVTGFGKVLRFKSINGFMMADVMPWSREEARGLCGVVLAGLFVMRAVYNHGGQVGVSNWRMRGKELEKGRKNLVKATEKKVKVIKEKAGKDAKEGVTVIEELLLSEKNTSPTPSRSSTPRKRTKASPRASPMQ